MKLVFILLACLGFSSLNAQQWDGSQTDTGIIYRPGNVGIGDDQTFPSFASLFVSSKAGSFSPSIMLKESAAPADNRIWGILTLASTFRIYSETDNYGAAQNAFEIHRNGVAITTTSFPNGNVGIGTTLANNPNGYKLAVKGKIGAQEVQVENASSTWADYVFDSSYNLMNLSEVENFIKLNRHLPEIPTAEDVKTNGHKLGEMDVLLLKKIEELTLYVIELKKEVEKVRAENEQMQLQLKH